MDHGIAVGIVGASGYSGGELVRLLSEHPFVGEIRLFSSSYAGRKYVELFPGRLAAGKVPGIRRKTEARHGAHLQDLMFEDLPRDSKFRGIDVLYLAVPASKAVEIVKNNFSEGCRIIDLSPDFRLKSSADYESWYGFRHGFEEGLAKFVYGLPEVNRESIRASTLVSNPGCYATGILLAISPILSSGIQVDDVVICDAKSGASGAGRGLREDTSFCFLDSNVVSYRPLRHAHTAEVERACEMILGKKVTVSFTPYLVPLRRGILGCAYFRLRLPVALEELYRIYEARYQDEPFVELWSRDNRLSLDGVVGTNVCRLLPLIDERAGVLKVFFALDNLLKGAAGQAVQNMNLMLGFSEEEGLRLQAVV